jgi:hypothetical protein
MMRGGARRRGPAARPARRRARRQTARRHRRRRRRRVLLVGGLVAFGAYKMSKKDADRIEEHTGTSPEEMTDEELERAMAELNIEKQYRDESDQEYADDSADQDYDDYEDAGEGDYLDELERLAELKEQGILTEEEFQAKKKQLLGL